MKFLNISEKSLGKAKLFQRKILLIGLTVLILFVVACQPTPPPPPGFSEFAPLGKATEAIGSHQVVDGGDTFMITAPEDKVFLLGPDEDGILKVETNGVETDDFVWGGFYTCPKGCDPDDINTYVGHQVTGNFFDEVWTKGSDVFAEITINRDNYEFGEHIVIGYVCKLIERGLFTSSWDCNADGEADTAENPPALLADYFKHYPDCEETDNGNDKATKGTITGIDADDNIYDAEPDTCYTDTMVNEYYCNLPMEPSGYCVGTATCAPFLSGFPKVCHYNGVPSGTSCAVASDCYYCSNNQGIPCTSNADCQFDDIFPQVSQTITVCDSGDVCFDGACEDVPFLNQAAPSKDGAVSADKVTAPSIVQLSTTAEVELEIDTTHDIIFSVFNFGQDYDFDETEAVSFAQTTQNYGSCITGTCQTININGFTAKGCGGNLFFPCQTNADCGRCSVSGTGCAQNSDCVITSGFDGGWIMANAGKTLSFEPQSTVKAHQEALRGDDDDDDDQGIGLDFGGNFLYVYGCDMNSGWDCHNQKWTQKPVILVPPCIDSDDGQDQTTQGKVTGMTEDGASFIVEETVDYTDYCVSTGVNNSVVKEFYCEANDDDTVVIKSQNIDCAEGETCFLGQCEVYEVPPGEI
ncbi:MAG: hypothetical protein KAT77_05235 [Nanoarchaeota archaeon]|nr:hypothetical protein [Nanoarchaeota archaeon]